MVHGAVDGKSRLVYFIKLSDNNRATTVLRGFKEGARLYGFPSRVRYIILKLCVVVGHKTK